jgi:hypothetical protein
MNFRQKNRDLADGDRPVALNTQTQVMVADQPGDGDDDDEPIDLESSGDVKC